MKATRKQDPKRQGTAAARAARLRPATGAQSGLAAVISASSRVAAQRAQLDAAFGPALQRQEEEKLQAKATPGVLQRQGEEEELQMSVEPGVLQRQGPGDEEMQAKAAPAANKTGMPDGLKAGIESLSGMDMSDMRVHFNSPRPTQLNALAYAQGNEIHLGPGQEKHLPHEVWHAVQQKQGRVRPTLQTAGAPINDDASLEREADVMGAKALQGQGQLEAATQAKRMAINHAGKAENGKTSGARPTVPPVPQHPSSPVDFGIAVQRKKAIKTRGVTIRRITEALNSLPDNGQVASRGDITVHDGLLGSGQHHRSRQVTNRQLRGDYTAKLERLRRFQDRDNRNLPGARGKTIAQLKKPEC